MFGELQNPLGSIYYIPAQLRHNQVDHIPLKREFDLVALSKTQTASQPIRYSNPTLPQ